MSLLPQFGAIVPSQSQALLATNYLQWNNNGGAAQHGTTNTEQRWALAGQWASIGGTTAEHWRDNGGTPTGQHRNIDGTTTERRLDDGDTTTGVVRGWGGI